MKAETHGDFECRLWMAYVLLLPPALLGWLAYCDSSPVKLGSASGDGTPSDTAVSLFLLHLVVVVPLYLAGLVIVGRIRWSRTGRIAFPISAPWFHRLNLLILGPAVAGICTLYWEGVGWFRDGPRGTGPPEQGVRRIGVNVLAALLFLIVVRRGWPFLRWSLLGALGMGPRVSGRPPRVG